MFLKKILVPLDGSSSSERALPYAAELARTAGASLTLVRTTDVHPRLHLLGLSHLLPEDPSRSLNIHAYRLRAQGLVIHTAVARGDPRGALVAEIERRQPDLVVTSTHGRSGINRLVHGSVADTVMSHVGCPVMLVRAQAATSASGARRLAGKRVVVPLDGSRFAEAALPLAVDLARTLGSDVLLVQAITPPYPLSTDLELLAPSTLDQALSLADAEDAATEYLNGLASRLSTGEQGVRATSLARVGHLTEVIRELNTDAQAQLDSPIGLVVMSTHSRTGLARALLGSEADAVVHGDHVPVVLVHPHSAESEKTLATSVRGER